MLLLLLLLLARLGQIVHRIQLRKAVRAAVAELLQVLTLMVETAKLLAECVQLMVDGAQIIQMLINGVDVIVADVGVVVVVDGIHSVTVGTMVAGCVGKE